MPFSRVGAAMQALKQAMALLGLPLGAPSVGSVEAFLAAHAPSSLNPDQSLDLGCGSFPRNPFGAAAARGVDIRPSPGNQDVVSADLFNQAIPFPELNFGAVTAFDFIEHVPRVACQAGSTRLPFIQLMNEVYRVLAQGGYFFSRTPAYPSKYSFQDPTHVNIITEDTFPFYFCTNNNRPYAEDYGFTGRFEMVAQAWCDGWLLTPMKKPIERDDSDQRS
jgi:SAM-dependent methyltransferase